MLLLLFIEIMGIIGKSPGKVYHQEVVESIDMQRFLVKKKMKHNNPIFFWYI